MARHLFDISCNSRGLANKAFLPTVLALVVFGTPGVAASPRGGAMPAARGDQFFLISSVDLAKRQIVLKAPTEVTELVRVNERTVFLDEQGKRIQFKDLRAGDTVYVTLAPGGKEPPLLLRVRKGPMTVEELRRRYLGSE